MLIGVNLSGLEDGSTFSTRAYFDYNVPTTSLAESWISLGCLAARIPHNLYRMQPGGQGTALDTTYLGYSTTLAQPCLTAGGFVIFDPHGFGSIQTSGTTVDITTTTGQTQYIDYMTRLAAGIKDWMGDADPSRVAIGLMNEPHQQTNATYQPLWNTVIAAMRTAGYTGVITVPWTDWQGAQQFSASNPVPAVTDPAGRCVVEVHCYLDPDDSGAGDASTSTTIGVERVSGLLASTLPDCYSGIVMGEIGCPADAVSAAALKNTLTLLNADSRVLATTVWTTDKWLINNGNYITTDQTDPRVEAMLSCLST